MKGKCFNKEGITDLKDKWQQYNMQWSDNKENIPTELYEIIEEMIQRIIFLENMIKYYEEDIKNE